MIGQRVFITPHSQKGHNRCLEHGQIWVIRKVWGAKVLVEAPATGGLRWIEGPDDCDFAYEILYEGEK